jgi:hypothetical protein
VVEKFVSVQYTCPHLKGYKWLWLLDSIHNIHQVKKIDLLIIMFFFPLFALLLNVVTAAPGLRPREDENKKPDYNNLTVAIVREEPPTWPMPIMNKNWTGIQFNLNATVQKGLFLIDQATSNGANLVVFPELWFPG